MEWEEGNFSLGKSVWVVSVWKVAANKSVWHWRNNFLHLQFEWVANSNFVHYYRHVIWHILCLSTSALSLSLFLLLSFIEWERRPHKHKTALFLSTNHIDPIRSHQLALRRATACDSHSPWQPTYVRGRKRRLALKSCLGVGSVCLPAERSQVPDNEIWPHHARL